MNLVLMMGVIMLVRGRSLYRMRLFMIVAVGVFVTVLMGVNHTVSMSMIMGVCMDVFMCMFFFCHLSSPFFVVLDFPL